jgi:16S rRNA (adenine1518-N6/adenine1519-N6)-dimethyltransferase
MQLGFHPSRALGQNFLVDRNILDIFISSSELSGSERVLEIGPGLGVVTKEILANSKSLVAVEKDRRLFAYLSEKTSAVEKLKLIEGDVLKVGIPRLLADGVDKVISNLPYTPGSRILLDMVRDENAPKDIIVTVQLEVAQRICAAPGSKAFGLMGVWCQLHYDVELIKVISPNCFWPRPDIKSAIVKLKYREKDILDKSAEDYFYKLTRYAFQQRRKQLASTLAKAPGNLAVDADLCRKYLEETGASASARPEELSLKQWCSLTQMFRRR